MDKTLTEQEIALLRRKLDLLLRIRRNREYGKEESVDREVIRY